MYVFVKECIQVCSPMQVHVEDRVSDITVSSSGAPLPYFVRHFRQELSKPGSTILSRLTSY